jgi:ethanolamine ammonia-lyase small subunit
MNEPVPIPVDKSLAELRERTPARVLVGRAGESYDTTTQLGLRADHAAARDAVGAELCESFLEVQKMAVVNTFADSLPEHLLRPDLGRRLNNDARRLLESTYPKFCDLQIVIGDGLSAKAVEVQVPGLLPRLATGTAVLAWSLGIPFAVRHCRVGVINDIGELLDARVVVLLIGERPGLATAESLSAYMAYRPRMGHTDAKRNLISNIHARGVGHDEAARRILELAADMMRLETSGVALKESLPALSLDAPAQ